MPSKLKSSVIWLLAALALISATRGQETKDQPATHFRNGAADRIGTTRGQETTDQPATPRPVTASFITSMSLLNESHKLGPGDRLSFRVIEDEDPPIALAVMDSGEMEVPYLGRMNAQGKSCKEAAYEIKSALEREYYIQASVILALDVIAPIAPKGFVSRGTIQLMGQVRSQGPQEIPSDGVYTVGKAVMRAGGFGEFANKRKVKLIRQVGTKGETETKVIDLLEVLEKGKMSKDVPVQPGDLIIVPERWINF